MNAGVSYHIWLRCKNSLEDFEFSSMRIGCFLICESPNCDGRKSNDEPSKLIISFGHKLLENK